MLCVHEECWGRECVCGRSAREGVCGRSAGEGLCVCVWEECGEGVCVCVWEECGRGSVCMKRGGGRVHEVKLYFPQDP